MLAGLSRIKYRRSRNLTWTGVGVEIAPTEVLLTEVAEDDPEALLVVAFEVADAVVAEVPEMLVPVENTPEIEVDTLVVGIEDTPVLMTVPVIVVDVKHPVGVTPGVPTQ